MNVEHRTPNTEHRISNIYITSSSHEPNPVIPILMPDGAEVSGFQNIYISFSNENAREIDPLMTLNRVRFMIREDADDN
jgi:hypothetical protein